MNSPLKDRWLNRPVKATLAAVLLAATLSGCVTNEEGGHPDGWEEITPAAVPELVALVPEDVASKGYLAVGSSPPFAPAEFRNSQGEIIGFDIDLTRAIAAVLGLKLQVLEQDFTLILPAVQAGTDDLGASGFTDNEKRRESFDFVDYLSAGIQWATQPGKSVDPDNACGLTVAVQRGTVSDTDDVTLKNEQCIAEGKPEIHKLSYDTSDAAATAVILGRADAFSADSPVSAWAVERSAGKLELSGEIFDAAPYGFPMKKGSPLVTAVGEALQHLIETGDYQRIMSAWGIEDGTLEVAAINGENIR